MAGLGLSLLLKLFCSLLFLSTMAKPAFARLSRSRAYIEASCRTTRYPALCIKYLSSYANTTSIQSPEQLAHLALSVSIYRALYTRNYVLKVAKELEASKVRGYQVVKDCLAEINDSIEQLSQSIKELHHLGLEPVGDDFFWHINNVETWVSAALTDASTCLDEFPVGKMSKLKATIKGKVLNVAQATSNALALFHRYATKYRATRATKKP
ncbi:hypothetical protein I3843_02G146800 [Carya illinoinensis]|uniref:Pectinesterase inhibitor domain-containing protein n=1 Tax=Carya illinoinensis TaxID=32201 RepID=A0A8T1RG02_CARIL|nr:pectinesterase inhibitor 9-like [Carya illinoinensis]KAG6665559.1 hypothetical protein CIPAW_02G169500 [Carya illinoinensis]KAG7992807.1 hypothetical protein I3843_02G146800 [Carya illinoinensis]